MLSKFNIFKELHLLSFLLLVVSDKFEGKVFLLFSLRYRTGKVLCFLDDMIY